MADSPPRSDVPDPASGDDLDAPWSASPPWWSRDRDRAAAPPDAEPPSGMEIESDLKVAPLPQDGEHTGPRPLPVPPDGSGPHRLPVPPDGSGPHRLPVPPDGSGPHRLPLSSNGTGPH